MPSLSVPLVPKNPNGPLRVLVIGRISTIHQNIENIDASYRYVQDRLVQMYKGETFIKLLGERASGMRTDRATIIEADEEIATGTWDLVITEDLGRLYRNPRYQYTFVQDAVDSGTRVICIGDNLDTAEENWEISLGAAALRHGCTIPETRRRVRRTATHAFQNGGMVQKVRYGYRRISKEEAASGNYGPVGLRVMKLADCTPIIREMRDRVLRGDHYEAIAEWLNDKQIKPGTYVKSGRWSARLVRNVLSDPILSGTRTFRDTICEPIFRTGRHRRLRNTGAPETKHYPELAHLTSAEHQQLLQIIEERAKDRRSKSGRDHVLYGRPRSRSIWPSQHLRCGICGGLMYRYDRDQLKCQNAHKRGSESCWNHVQVSGSLVRERVLDWLIGYCEGFASFRETLIDAAWKELEKHRRGLLQEDSAISRQVDALQRQRANLTKAIAMGGHLPSLLQELAQVEESLKSASRRLSNARQSCSSRRSLENKNDVEANLFLALREVGQTSYEFGTLMREIVKDFVVLPIQSIDSSQVRPRVRFSAHFISSPHDHVSGSTGGEVQGVKLDVFDPPLHICHLSQCIDARGSGTLWQIAEKLGLSKVTIERAFRCADRMQAENVTEPYRELIVRPKTAARWKSENPDT